MLKISIAATALTLLAGCASLNTKVVDPLITDISRINNTASADLQVAQNVAQAATPPDVDGFNCAGAAVTASAQINKVLAAATAGGASAGAFTTAEIASLFQPGSQQYNAINQLLVSGCAAKATDVLGAAGVMAAGGVAGAIAASNIILPLAAAAP